MVSEQTRHRGPEPHSEKEKLPFIANEDLKRFLHQDEEVQPEIKIRDEGKEANEKEKESPTPLIIISEAERIFWPQDAKAAQELKILLNSIREKQRSNS